MSYDVRIKLNDYNFAKAVNLASNDDSDFSGEVWPTLNEIRIDCDSRSDASDVKTAVEIHLQDSDIEFEKIELVAIAMSVRYSKG